MKYAHMAKAIAGAVQAGLIAGAATLGTALADGQVTVTEWLIVLAAVVGAASGVGTVVYGVTNAPNPKPGVPPAPPAE